MTQEVQPLTWSKRTNIEEHQQFFSKINEIIGNLAPTVNEAEQAIAQATAAIASANDAVATANAASTAASAAASQAQTAASTVAGYDTRLTAAEGDITALQNVQADYVKKDGAAQTVTSQIMVPTTATGGRDTQIANGTRIQNDLDAYEPMMRTTGNQNVAGIKTFTDQLRRTSPDWSYLELRATKADKHTIPSSNIRLGGINFQDTNGDSIVALVVDLLSDGHISVLLEGVDSNGNYWNSVILNRQVIF